MEESLDSAVFPVVDILGVGVHSISINNLVDFIIQNCKQNRKTVVSNVNVHAVNLAYEQPWFRQFLNNSNIVFCDGFGIKWAAKLFYRQDLYRYTPPDWFPLLAERCAQENIGLFFVGAREGVAVKAAEKLTTQFPTLKICGVHHGHFDKSPGSQEQQQIIEEINHHHPGILVVGFGMPLQEKWILEHWSQLDANVVLPVGAFFDYMAGETARAPRWMTNHGFEWLGRLVIEPRRLWKRYIVGNPVFIWRVLLYRLGILKLKS